MTFNYDEALNSLDLSTVCRAVVLDTEAPAVYPGDGYDIPGRVGVRLDPEADVNALLVAVRVYPRFTDASGAVTHTDGEEGHWEENLAAVKAELRKRSVTLRRTFPHKGRLRAVGRATDTFPVSTGLQFNLLVSTGSWQNNAESDSGAASTSPSVTTDGDTEIHDPVIQFNAAGTLTHTEDDGDSATVTVASGPTFPVTVYIAGTDGVSDLYAEDDNGVDVTGDVTTNKAYGLRFPAASGPLSLSSTSNVIVKWRNRWA